MRDASGNDKELEKVEQLFPLPNPFAESSGDAMSRIQILFDEKLGNKRIETATDSAQVINNTRDNEWK